MKNTEQEQIRQEIRERMKEFVGRMEFTEQGITLVNGSMAEIVKRLSHAGEIEVGPTNDPSSNGEIRLGEGVPLDILPLIPGALPEVSEYGKYHVMQGGGIIGYVTYAGQPEQDMMNCVFRIGTKAAFTSAKTKEKSFSTDGNGLRHKYKVFKADTGEAIENCFVLRPDRDRAARDALRAYIVSTENLDLARDLDDWLHTLEEGR